MVQPKVERQIILYEQYFFNCKCIACENNFPLFHKLKSFNKKILKSAKKLKVEILSMEHSEALANFRTLCELIKNNHEKHGSLSSEMILLLECLQDCTAIILKPKTLIP